jgi:hypothetical protein
LTTSVGLLRVTVPPAFVIDGRTGLERDGGLRRRASRTVHEDAGAAGRKVVVDAGGEQVGRGRLARSGDPDPAACAGSPIAGQP